MFLWVKREEPCHRALPCQRLRVLLGSEGKSNERLSDLTGTFPYLAVDSQLQAGGWLLGTSSFPNQSPHPTNHGPKSQCAAARMEKTFHFQAQFKQALYKSYRPSPLRPHHPCSSGSTRRSPLSHFPSFLLRAIHIICSSSPWPVTAFPCV